MLGRAPASVPAPWHVYLPEPELENAPGPEVQVRWARTQRLSEGWRLRLKKNVIFGPP